MLLDWIRRRRLRRDAALALYGEIVRQARSRVLYDAFAVADTLDGRFDLVVLHAYMLLRRLRGKGRAARQLSQALFDVMFADMDRSLREIGVSDHSISKRVRDMIKAFYGRIAAYDLALAGPPGELAAALLRNVYREAESRESQAAGLADYVRRQAAALESQPLPALLRGEVGFAPVEAR
jgi:cytochrome b pre-mRNA-processing protein 3